MPAKNFVELTNASSKKLNRILVNIDDISAIEEPENTESIGCILLVNDQLLPVKESYSKLILFLKTQYGDRVQNLNDMI